MKSKLTTLIAIIASLALLFAPTQISLPKLPMTLSDLLLVLAFFVIILLFIIDKERLKLFPQIPVFIFLIAALFSIVVIFSSGSGGFGSFAKEIFKYILYLLIGVSIFKIAFTESKWRKIALICLTIGVTFAVLIGGYQRYKLNYIANPEQRTVIMTNSLKAFTTIETPVSVGSTFGSWSDKGFHGGFVPYACFLALVLPFIMFLALKKPIWWVVAAPILLLTGYSVLAGRIMPIILIALLITAWLYNKRAGIIITSLVIIYIGLISFVPSINKTQILKAPYEVMISQADADYYYSGERHLKKFFAEEYASLNLIRGTESELNVGLLGVGLSRYQDNIQEGYSTLGQTSNQRLHLGEQGGYFITLASMGMLGLICLIFMYWHYLKSALKLKTGSDKIYAPIIGSIIALILLTFVSTPFMRGEGIILAALLGLIENQRQQLGEKE